MDSENSEHSQNSPENVRKQNIVRQEGRTTKAVTPTQGESCEFREHSRESLDPMASIRNLHTQQRQN